MINPRHLVPGPTIQLPASRLFVHAAPLFEEERHFGRDAFVVKLDKAKRGFVLLPRRWVVERSFAWATRFRRLVKDYERLPTTLAGLHFVAYLCLMLRQFFAIVG